MLSLLGYSYLQLLAGIIYDTRNAWLVAVLLMMKMFTYMFLFCICFETNNNKQTKGKFLMLQNILNLLLLIYFPHFLHKDMEGERGWAV